MLSSLLSWNPILASRGIAAVACTLLLGLPRIDADTPRAAVIADSAAVTGTWKLQRYGTHILTTNPDGTATMQMKMNRLAALSYGKELRLDLRWTMEGGVLKQRVVGGAPASAVAKLLNDYGDTYDYRILERTKDHILVEDLASPGTPIRWEAGDRL